MRKKDQIPSDEQYIATATELLPAGSGETFVWDHTCSRYRILPEATAQILRVADRFRTLKEHLDVLSQAGWQDDGSGFVADALVELIGEGLLRSKRDFVTKVISHATTVDTPQRISSMAWITRNRPELLLRSLESHVENNRSLERQVIYKVFDDSPVRETRIRVRTELASVAKREQVEVFYAGMDEKRTFTAELFRTAEKEGVPRSVIEFALFDPYGLGYTVGANCNALLLGTTGELTLVLDDDTVCRFVEPSESESGIALCSSADPTVMQFYPDRETLLRSVHLQPVNILGYHEQLLGRVAADCVAFQGTPGRMDCSRALPSLVRLLEFGQGRVMATITGVCGDSGMGSPFGILGLEGRGREAWEDSEQAYRSALTSREVLRRTGRPTLSRGGMLMTMNCGLDNRRLLPPFFPVLRNPDGVMAQTLLSCWPGSLVGHLPVAVLHQPYEARRFAPEEATEAPIRVPDLLILLAQDFTERLESADPERRIQALGAFFRELAVLNPFDFEQLLRRRWVTAASRHIEYLEILLSRYGREPLYWAEDVLSQIEKVRDRATRAGPIWPDDLAERGAGTDSATLCQKLVGCFGELLCWWPAIVSAAKLLAAQESRIFTRV